MKKKLLAIMLSTAMALSLTACGAGNETNTDNPSTENNDAEDVQVGEKLQFEVIVKSFQSTYWQAAVKGINQACEELNVDAAANGPMIESDISDQVQMLKDAIEKQPDGIGIAACDKESVIGTLQTALDKNIPVVCFDTGVPNAPEGSVYATVATDNLAAGATAAEHMYPVIKEKIMTAEKQVRIGVVNQDATAQNIQERGLGFTEKMMELIKEDGKTIAVTGNEFYVNACSEKGDLKTADVVIEFGVPKQTTVAESANVAQGIMAKADTIAMFGSNEVTAEGIISANDILGVLNSDPSMGIVAAGFDAGTRQKEAINAGLFIGSVTQSPLMMGYETIKTLYKICQGEEVSDIAMNGYWYDTTNMEDDNIKPNLYN